MDWYCLTLASDQVSTGKIAHFERDFKEAFTAARGPRTMALFQKFRDEGGVDLFLTPECGKHAGELLALWGCIPCQRPSLLGLQLLVGHNEITYYLP